MRILKTVILCLAFVLAVFLCSANVHNVELHYVPDLGIEQIGEPRSLEAPLFLMLLAAVALGLVLGGSAALFEQTRLKLELRQAKKAVKKLHEQAVADESEIGVQREEVARQAAEISRLARERDDIAAAADAAASVVVSPAGDDSAVAADDDPTQSSPSAGHESDEPDKT